MALPPIHVPGVALPQMAESNAAIAQDSSLGLRYEITELSQSSAAMKDFLNHRVQVGEADLRQ